MEGSPDPQDGGVALQIGVPALRFLDVGFL